MPDAKVLTEAEHAEFVRCKDQFHALDKAMTGLKSLITLETGAKLDALREELGALVAKEQAAQAAVVAKKSEMEAVTAAHASTPKFQELKAKRRLIAAELIALTGKDEWWK